MICIVLAAGYATRMYPLTESYPKPLLKVQRKPILNWLLDDVDRIPAIEHIIIVSNHKFIEPFREWKKQQQYSKPLSVLDDGSTRNENRIGAVKDIQVALGSLHSISDALVIAGDNVLEFSFRHFVDYFNSIDRSCVMCYREPDVVRQRKTGIITIDQDNRVTLFSEKPEEPLSDLAVPPFYCYTKSDLHCIDRAISSGCSIDAPGSLAAWLCENSIVHAWMMPGKRYDIGSIEGYKDVQKLFQPQRVC